MALRILGQNGGATIKELFVSPHAYSLAQAIYDAPFYWMVQDEAYLPTLTKNRGDDVGILLPNASVLFLALSMFI